MKAIPMRTGLQRAVDEPNSAFVLDTDIGSDVDDLLALAVVLGSPELEATAVTTVYGDVAVRARIVAKAYASAHRQPPCIAAGLGHTRSGRPAWWAGHEGSTIDDLEDQEFTTDASAIDAIAAAELVVAIGPLTNVAAALERTRRRLGHIVMMGGAFDGRTEHNIRSDADSAGVVFDSGVEITTVGIEMTERVRFTESDLSRLSGDLGSLITREVQRYWAFAAQAWNNPHDPIAILMMATPELFEFERGRIRIDATELVTGFESDPAGPHRIVRDLDVDGVRQELVARMRRACAL
jgi:purine nucleosidase